MDNDFIIDLDKSSSSSEWNFDKNNRPQKNKKLPAEKQYKKRKYYEILEVSDASHKKIVIHKKRKLNQADELKHPILKKKQDSKEKNREFCGRGVGQVKSLNAPINFKDLELSLHPSKVKFCRQRLSRVLKLNSREVQKYVFFPERGTKRQPYSVLEKDVNQLSCFYINYFHQFEYKYSIMPCIQFLECSPGSDQLDVKKLVQLKLSGQRQIVNQTDVYAHFMPRARYPPNMLALIPNKIGCKYQINYIYKQFGIEEVFNGYPNCYFNIQFTRETKDKGIYQEVSKIESHDQSEVVNKYWIQNEGRQASHQQEIIEQIHEDEAIIGFRIGLSRSRVASSIQFLIAKVTTVEPDQSDNFE